MNFFLHAFDQKNISIAEISILGINNIITDNIALRDYLAQNNIHGKTQNLFEFSKDNEKNQQQLEQWPYFLENLFNFIINYCDIKPILDFEYYQVFLHIACDRLKDLDRGTENEKLQDKSYYIAQRSLLVISIILNNIEIEEIEIIFSEDFWE